MILRRIDERYRMYFLWNRCTYLSLQKYRAVHGSSISHALKKYSYLYFNIHIKREYKEASSTAGKIQVHLFRTNHRLHELQTFDVDTVATSGMTSEILRDNEQLFVINRQLRQTR